MIKITNAIASITMLLGVLSCQKEDLIIPSRPEAIEILSKEDRALKSSSGVEVENKVLLGFKLGMEDTEVEKYVKKLYKNGKMRKSKIGDEQQSDDGKSDYRYVYDIELPESGTLTLIFNSNYKEGKLYRISCTPIIEEYMDFDKIWMELEGLLTDAYSKPSIKYQGAECVGNIWLVGNVMVEQKCWEGEQKIEYSDAEVLTKNI